MSEIVVIAKCVECGETKEVKAGEVPEGEMPTCPKCYSFMIAEKAERK